MIRKIITIVNILFLFTLSIYSVGWSESVKDRLKKARKQNGSNNTAVSANQKTPTPTESFENEENITLSPKNGTIVHPGETINIKVDLPDKAVIDGVFFIFDKKMHSIEGSGPYEFPYEIPNNRLGKIDIYAYTFGPQQNFEARSTIMVKANQELKDFDIVFYKELLNHPEGFSNILLTGIYSDGSKADISTSEAGTIYRLKSGTEDVISITKDGVIRTHGLGQETIIITNSGLEKEVSINIIY